MTSSTAGHTAFTPGPWHFYARGEGFIIRSKTAQGPVAGVNGNRPIEDAEANARLIAAAPSLLEALEVARKWLVINDDRRSQSGIEVVEAAIAAAKGGA